MPSLSPTPIPLDQGAEELKARGEDGLTEEERNLKLVQERMAQLVRSQMQQPAPAPKTPSPQPQPQSLALPPPPTSHHIYLQGSRGRGRP